MEDTNDDEAQVDATEEQDEQDLDQDLPEDTTDWKAEAVKARRIASRLRGKVTKLTEAKKPEPTKEAPSKEDPPKPTELGYAELAYLEAKGISSDEEQSMVQKAMIDSGKSLKDVVASKWFQAELKEARDAKASQEALPPAGKRGTGAAKDSVQYWVTKGELPPNTPENVELRRQVVAAKRGSATSGSKFYNSK